MAVSEVLRSTVYFDQDGVHLRNYFRPKTVLFQEIKEINWGFIPGFRGAPVQVIEITTGEQYIQLPLSNYLRAEISLLLEQLKARAPQARFDEMAADMANNDWEKHKAFQRKKMLGLLKVSAVSLGILATACVIILAGRHFWLENKISRFVENFQTQTYSQEEIIALENKAEEIGNLFNVSARRQVDVFFELGDAYCSAEKLDLAKDTYRKGLALNPGNTEYQFKLAVLELKTAEGEQAVAGLRDIVRADGPREYVRAAQNLLEGSENSTAEAPAVEAPERFDRTVYLVSFEKEQAAYYPALIRKIREEYKFNVKIVDEVLTPVKKNQRRVASSDLGIQYSAEEQIAYLLGHFGPLLAQDDTVGVIGLIPEDIYARNTNFVFSLTGVNEGEGINGEGIINCERLSEPAESAIKRINIQALSSVGHMLGWENCTIARCARSYSHSLEELDRKSDTLCDKCRKKLAEIAE